jgi:hypothetical protein
MAWEEGRVKDNEIFVSCLIAGLVREKLFGDKFIDGLEKRRDALLERQRKLITVQLTLTFFLAVSLFVPSMPIAVFGLNSNAGSFRELLMVLVGSLPIYGVLGSIEASQISDAMLIYLQKQAGDDVATLRVLKLRYGLFAGIRAPDITSRVFSSYQKAKFAIGAVGGLIWLLITFLAVASLALVGAISILLNPTYLRTHQCPSF